VEGTQYLTTGSYSFYCTIHAFMVGTLHVSANGTPRPRPGGGGGGAPALRLALPAASLASLRHSGKLRVTVTLDAAARVGLSADTRIKGHRTALGSFSADLASGGSKVSLRLSKAARKALAKLHSARITVAGHATNAAGASPGASASRTYH
jgi:hypothetical protein